MTMDNNTPCVSFIGIVDFSQEARWLFLTDSVSDLLGFEPHELIGRPSLELVHPDEFVRVKQMHYDTISEDKAAVLAYLRLKHKDPYKGYILCGISRTVVHDVLVGSVSFASPGPKAMHNASTAQEIEVVTPTAKNFEFRRWADSSPMPPSPVLRPASSSSSSSSERFSSAEPGPSKPRKEAITFDPLPKQSIRTALILDRFTVNSTIIYVTNDNFVSTTLAISRSFYDFVAKKDEEIVRSWIDVIKSWGVNERGQPSDGGFGFGKFAFCPKGRDSSARIPDPPSQRHRQGQNSRSKSLKYSQTNSSSKTRSRVSHVDTSEGEHIIVDAIFSAHSDGVMVILRKSSS